MIASYSPLRSKHYDQRNRPASRGVGAADSLRFTMYHQEETLRNDSFRRYGGSLVQVILAAINQPVLDMRDDLVWNARALFGVMD